MKRILAALALCIIVVPTVLALYLGLSTGATMLEFGSAFVSAIPLGDLFYSIAVSAVSGNASGVTSSANWFANSQNVSSMYLMYEYGQVFLIGIFVMALDKVLDVVFGCNEGAFSLETIGDILCKLPMVLVASLIANKIYGFCGDQIALLPLEATDTMLFTVALISFIGGIAAIVLAGGFLKSFIQVTLKLLVVSWTYVSCILVAYSLLSIPVVIISWIILVLICEVVGRLVDKLM